MKHLLKWCKCKQHIIHLSFLLFFLLFFLTLCISFVLLLFFFYYTLYGSNVSGSLQGLLKNEGTSTEKWLIVKRRSSCKVFFFFFPWVYVAKNGLLPNCAKCAGMSLSVRGLKDGAVMTSLVTLHHFSAFIDRFVWFCVRETRTRTQAAV